MKSEAYIQPLRELLRAQSIAALGTLHQGNPYVSMVPFALLPDGAGFVIHVSTLAVHTRDMLHHPQVSLLVMARPTPEVPAQALARVTILGRAMQIDDGAEGQAAAKDAYLARFPESAPMFGFADFSLFAIHPESARYVGGYAQATTISAATLARVLTQD